MFRKSMSWKVCEVCEEKIKLVNLILKDVVIMKSNIYSKTL